MTNTERIVALEEQLKQLQMQISNLKTVNKLEVIRSFTGEIFSPFEGIEYRRLCSSGIYVWEQFDHTENKWSGVLKETSEQLEELYKQI